MLAAVNLRHDLVADDPTIAARVGMACRKAGVLVRPLVGGAIAVSPPLVIGEGETAEIAHAFGAALDEVAADPSTSV